MNITERFFRAIGWRNAPEDEIYGGGYLEWKPPKPIKETYKNGTFNGTKILGMSQLPDITQSWPDFKKYVIPVMRERGWRLVIYADIDMGARWHHKETDRWRAALIKNDEILLAAVEAAVEVLEGEK